ncbi:MAG: hypothetical protein ACU837_06345 [Gammaproteobacteria bacterium]
MGEHTKKKSPFSLFKFQTILEKFDRDIMRSTLKNYFDNGTLEHYLNMLERVSKGQLVILSSMTYEEKEYPDVLNNSRIQRIATGSGKKIEDVERMLKAFKSIKRYLSKLKAKPDPDDSPTPSPGAASMAVPKPYVCTKAIGRKYRA